MSFVSRDIFLIYEKFRFDRYIPCSRSPCTSGDTEKRRAVGLVHSGTTEFGFREGSRNPRDIGLEFIAVTSCEYPPGAFRVVSVVHFYVKTDPKRRLRVRGRFVRDRGANFIARWN
jgi:hypothetical protein